MKRILLIISISLLLVGCGNEEIIKTEEPTPNVTTTTTTEITTTTIETTTTTTEATTTTKKINYKKVGNYVIYYGKYKGVFDDVPDLKATITINEDGTATYVGNVDSHGDRKDFNRKGTWSIEGDFIVFKWSDGESEGYWIGKKSFSDQWHTFKLK